MSIASPYKGFSQNSLTNASQAVQFPGSLPTGSKFRAKGRPRTISCMLYCGLFCPTATCGQVTAFANAVTRAPSQHRRVETITSSPAPRGMHDNCSFEHLFEKLISWKSF